MLPIGSTAPPEPVLPQATPSPAASSRGCADRASWSDRTEQCSRLGARHVLQLAVHHHARSPIAWATGSTGRVSSTLGAPTSSRTPRRSASLQVPASGQPILLMADRQTTGGYPKIGDGDRRRSAAGRTARARRLDRVRALHAGRGRRRAQAQASGAPWEVGVTDAIERRLQDALRRGPGAARCAARAVHDVQGRRSRRLAGAGAYAARTSDARSPGARAGGCP